MIPECFSELNISLVWNVMFLEYMNVVGPYKMTRNGYYLFMCDGLHNLDIVGHGFGTTNWRGPSWDGEWASFRLN